MDFKGKRVLITAAGRGIARRGDERYAAAGAQVFASDIDANRLADLKARHPAVHTHRADVSNEDEVDALFAAAHDALGGLDILLAAAGIGGEVAPVETMSTEGWRRCVGINLDGAFFCARRAIPMIKAAGEGSIVLFSSMSGLYPYLHRSPYCAAKFGIIGLAKVLAMELGPDGINVNAICPGAVEGERMAEVMAAEGRARGIDPATLRQSYTQYSSMRTFISADDVINMVMFVTSEAGRHVSGQALAVDGHTESFAG